MHPTQRGIGIVVLKDFRGGVADLGLVAGAPLAEPYAVPPSVPEEFHLLAVNLDCEHGTGQRL